MAAKQVLVGNRQVALTNLDKLLWPEGISKAHLIKYYSDVAPVLLAHIHNRPLVMKRYPDGINGEAFYQKECPGYAPDWVQTLEVLHTERTINYIICNDLATLVWLVNQACIEVHAWLSTRENIDCPDIAVMDLDPADRVTFADVMQVALLVRQALAEFGLEGYIKTSGLRGLHLFIPLKPVYPFQMVTAAMHYIAQLVNDAYPERTTLERVVEKRGCRVYLDYLQNGRGKTMAFPYSVRPRPGAPVSTPLLWSEVKQGEGRSADIRTIFWRLKEYGDLFGDLALRGQSLEKLLSALPRDLSAAGRQPVNLRPGCF